MVDKWRDPPEYSIISWRRGTKTNSIYFLLYMCVGNFNDLKCIQIYKKKLRWLTSTIILVRSMLAHKSIWLKTWVRAMFPSMILFKNHWYLMSVAWKRTKWMWYLYSMWSFFRVIFPWCMKRIKYEIRLGAQHAHVHRPTSTGPKKVEPILCLGPLTEQRPRLAHQVSENLLHKDETCSVRMRLALQGGDLLCKDETCSTRKGDRTSLL